MDDILVDEFAGMDRHHWWFQGRRRIIADVIRRHLGHQPPRSILDVGCGTGEMLDMLAAFGPVQGMDASPKAVEHCRERFGSTIPVRTGRLPDDVAGHHDLVTAFDVIEHLDDDTATLRRIAGALPPGGLFVCTVPAFMFLWSEHDDLNHHRRRYTRTGLIRVLQEAGFEIEDVTYFNAVLFAPIAAVRFLHRFRRGGTGTPRSDLATPPRWINRLLTALFGAERFALRVTSLPVGVSLIAVARRSHCAPSQRPEHRQENSAGHFAKSRGAQRSGQGATRVSRPVSRL